MTKMILVLLTLAMFYAGAALAAVNINTADVSSLAALDGIGPVKAKAIVAYRKAHGDFKSVDKLADVKGVGSKTVDKLREEATVGKES